MRNEIYLINGILGTVSDHARRCGFSPKTIMRRMERWMEKHSGNEYSALRASLSRPIQQNMVRSAKPKNKKEKYDHQFRIECEYEICRRFRRWITGSWSAS